MGPRDPWSQGPLFIPTCFTHISTPQCVQVGSSHRTSANMEAQAREKIPQSNIEINESAIHTDQMVDSTPWGIMQENNDKTLIPADQIIGSTPQRVQETRRRSRLRCAQTGDI